MPGAGLEPARAVGPRDFKSRASADFATPATAHRPPPPPWKANRRTTMISTCSTQSLSVRISRFGCFGAREVSWLARQATRGPRLDWIGIWRRRSDSNRCIEVLQTSPLTTWVRRRRARQSSLCASGHTLLDPHSYCEPIRALAGRTPHGLLLRSLRLRHHVDGSPNSTPLWRKGSLI